MLVIILLRLNVPCRRSKFIRQKPLFKQSPCAAVAVVERVNADEHQMDERGVIESFFQRQITPQEFVDVFPQLVHFPLQ